MKSWLRWPKAKTNDGAPKDSAAQLQSMQLEQGFWGLLAFTVIQVTSIVLFASSFGADQSSTCYVIVVLITLGLHIPAVTTYAFYRARGDSLRSHQLPSIFMGCVLVIDVALFALARPDIQIRSDVDISLE